MRRDGGNRVTVSPALRVSSLELWRDVNGCHNDPVITDVPDSRPDGINVKKLEYTGCSHEDTDMIHYMLINGTHQWFNGISNDIDNNLEAWNFFKRHSNDKVVTALAEEQSTIHLFPNPAVNHLRIKTSGHLDGPVRIYDRLGQLIQSGFVNTDGILALPPLSTGVYYLQYSDGRQLQTAAFVVQY